MPRPTFFNLPQEKRLRIAELAIDEFCGSAYSSASITRLVARAGIAKGSFYQYFQDKEDLYEWLLMDYIAQEKLRFFVSAPVTLAGDFFARLSQLIGMGLQFGVAQPRLARASRWVVPPVTDPAVLPMAQRLIHTEREMTRGLLQLGQREGSLREDLDLELAVDLVVSLRHTLDLMFERTVGLPLMEVLEKPERLAALSPALIQTQLDLLMDVLRRGLGSPSHGAASSLNVDQLEGLLEEATHHE